MWNFHAKDSYSSSPPLAALPYLAAPPASALPSNTVWRPLSQRSIHLVIIELISMDLQTLIILVKITWENTRGLSEFQLLLRHPRHSVSTIDVNWQPTIPGGVA